VFAPCQSVEPDLLYFPICQEKPESVFQKLFLNKIWFWKCGHGKCLSNQILWVSTPPHAGLNESAGGDFAFPPTLTFAPSLLTSLRPVWLVQWLTASVVLYTVVHNSCPPLGRGRSVLMHVQGTKGRYNTTCSLGPRACGRSVPICYRERPQSMHQGWGHPSRRLFIPFSCPRRLELWGFPFYRWGNWVPRKVADLLTVL
jgi:hypothetical protein